MLLESYVQLSSCQKHGYVSGEDTEESIKKSSETRRYCSLTNQKGEKDII